MPQSLITRMAAKWWFLKFCLLHLLVFYWKEEYSLLPHLFIYLFFQLFMCLYQHELMGSYFIQRVTVCCYHLFQCSNWPRFAQWKFLNLALVSFWHVPIIFWVLLYFLAQQDVTAYIALSLLNHFTKDPWFLLVGNGIYKSIHFSSGSNDDVGELFGMEFV